MFINFLTKKEILSHLLKCTTPIPTNDFEAYSWSKNKCYLHLYNKWYIFQSQQIESGISTPPHYPVFVKPNINLFGMGRYAKVIHSLKEYLQHKQLYQGDLVWSRWLKGDHFSVDLFIQKGEIKSLFCFKGISDSLGTFHYWKTMPTFILPKKCMKWVLKNLKRYTGCINIELINDSIIECHLRIGDIHFLDMYWMTQGDTSCPILSSVIALYNNNFTSTNSLTIPIIYQFPIFIPKKDYIYNLVSYANAKKICLKYKVLILQKDPSSENVSNPLGGNRIFSFITTDFEKGEKAKRELIHFYFKKLYSINNEREKEKNLFTAKPT